MYICAQRIQKTWYVCAQSTPTNNWLWGISLFAGCVHPTHPTPVHNGGNCSSRDLKNTQRFCEQNTEMPTVGKLRKGNRLWVVFRGFDLSVPSLWRRLPPPFATQPHKRKRCRFHGYLAPSESSRDSPRSVDQAPCLLIRGVVQLCSQSGRSVGAALRHES